MLQTCSHFGNDGAQSVLCDNLSFCVVTMLGVEYVNASCHVSSLLLQTVVFYSSSNFSLTLCSGSLRLISSSACVSSWEYLC